MPNFAWNNLDYMIIFIYRADYSKFMSIKITYEVGKYKNNVIPPFTSLLNYLYINCVCFFLIYRPILEKSK